MIDIYFCCCCYPPWASAAHPPPPTPRRKLAKFETCRLIQYTIVARHEYLNFTLFRFLRRRRRSEKESHSAHIMDMFLSNNIDGGSFTNWNQQKAQSALKAMGGGCSSSKLPSLSNTTTSSEKVLFKINKNVPMSKMNEHPSWKCRRVGCDGFLTLLGSSVNGHIDDMNLSRRRAVNKRETFPATFEHGSPLTCSCCGDRPKPEKGGRRAAWQRLCVICGEPYAMNGFWTKHGGCNRRGVSVGLERRSHVHMSNMRKHFKTVDDMACLPDTLKKEKKWIALALSGTIDKEKHAISDSTIENFKESSEMMSSKMKKTPSVYSQLMRNINQDKITLGKMSSSRGGGFKSHKIGEQSTRNAVSFQLSAADQLKHLEKSNLATTGQNVAFRRKRTTIRKNKQPKRSRSDLEAGGYDDKIDGFRGRHGPEKRKMFETLINCSSSGSSKMMNDLSSSTKQKKKRKPRKKKSTTTTSTKKKRNSKKHSHAQLDSIHPNQTDHSNPSSDSLIILPSLSFKSSTGDRSFGGGGDLSLASLDSCGGNSFQFNHKDVDSLGFQNLGFNSLASLDQYPSIASIADSLDDIAITPTMLEGLTGSPSH